MSYLGNENEWYSERFKQTWKENLPFNDCITVLIVKMPAFCFTASTTHPIIDLKD